MSSDSRSLNNKDRVSHALDAVTSAMQGIIITTMTYAYGDEWWNEKVVSQRTALGITRPLQEVDYVDTDFARECLDTQLCCKLLRREKKLFFSNNYSSISRLLTNVQEIRNERSHTGKMTYSAEESHQALDDLMEFSRAMGMDAGVLSELQALKDDIAEPVPVSETKSNLQQSTMVPDSRSQNTIVLRTEIPGVPMTDIGQICVNSCVGYYDAATDAQERNHRTSRSMSDAIIISRDKNTFVLDVGDKKLSVEDTTGIIIDGEDYGTDSVSFDGFDRTTHRVRMYLRPELSKLVKDDSRIQLYNDMRWLITRTQSFFDTFGGMISYPPKPEVFAANSMLSSLYKDMAKDQEDAVKVVLDSPLSYVWGVPGSGKTRYVLATAINECVRRGERVAVIAPTNYALEQVLNGLLAAFRDNSKNKVNPETDLVRVGTPTAEFLGKNPSVCERKGVQAAIRMKRALLASVEVALAEKRYASLEPKMKEALAFASGAGSKTSSGPGKLLDLMKPFLNAVRIDPRYKTVASGINTSNVLVNAQRIYDLIYVRKRSTVGDSNLLSKSEADLERMRSDIRGEISRLESENPKADINNCKIVAMTLSKFIASFGPNPVDGRAALRVDRVFVDEAGYCNCIQTMALFTLGVPITFLGDHMQLPPVCEVDSEHLKESIGSDDHGYDYLWGLSALYADSLFEESMDVLSEMYKGDEEPRFRYTAQAKLFETHRFGQNLADVLGNTVYGFNIRSAAKEPLEIEVIDCHIDRFPTGYGGKVVRKNEKEAEAILDYVTKRRLDPDQYVVMTPYREQVKEIRRQGKGTIPDDNVSTIHSSQGKEWDTVIISVCDGRACTDEKPPRFTTTVVPGSIGIKVINTAVSRAKKRLVIVCDVGYWSSRESEFISWIIRRK